MKESVYRVKFFRKAEGILCTWKVEGMDYETIRIFCMAQKEIWKCSSVAIFTPSELIPGSWKLAEMI